MGRPTSLVVGEVARATWFACNARALLIVDRAQMRLRPEKQSSDITEPITDHTSLGPPGLPPASRPIRMSGWIGRRVEDLSARLTDLALLLVGTPARETPAHEGRYVGALAGWNTPDLSASSSARMMCTTALISARWVNACGKLPRCRPVRGSISSA